MYEVPSQTPRHPPAAPGPRHASDAGDRDVAWFLRRELLTLPLAAAVVAVLLLFGISPATLLFVALMVVLTLGWLWGGRP